MSYKHQSGTALYLRLLSSLRRYWLAFAIAILANAVFSGVDASFTYLLKPVLNRGFIERDLVFIKFLPFLIFGVFVLRSIANFSANYFMTYVSRGVVMRFRQQIFKHLLCLPSFYYDSTTSGQILAILLYDVEQIANAGSDALTSLVQSSCLIIGLLVVMFSISWHLSLLFLITVPIISMVVYASNKRLRNLSLNVQKRMGDLTSIAEESIEGYKVIRAFGAQKYEQGKFVNATNSNRLGQLKMVVTKSLTVSLVQLIAAIALSITIYLATSNRSITMLTAGSFVSLIAAMLALLKPLKNFTTVNANIQRGLAGAQTVFKILDCELEQNNGKYVVNRVDGRVSFLNVKFSYTGESSNLVLNNINLEVEAGQTVALVGHSGGGKTTLVNLLPRFYDGFSGTISIDGTNIREYELSVLRRQFALVSQNVILFDDTIANNIAYGQFANVNEEEVISAAKAAYAWEFIKDLPLGLQTMIGENGLLLSGGQRQRLAIARAILKNAPILILDEATSSLDTESERQIQDALNNLIQNRTTFVIAHRLSTIEHADLILVISEGSIIEYGNHNSLLEKSGHYAKLYKMQFKNC